MIKQLFKANLLGMLVLPAFMLLAFSGLNEIKAQQTSLGIVSSEQVRIDPSEYQQFTSEIKALYSETENSSQYSETEKAVRFFYYKEVYNGVSGGLQIETAILRAKGPTVEYINQFKNGNRVNLRAIVENTRQRLL